MGGRHLLSQIQLLLPVRHEFYEFKSPFDEEGLAEEQEPDEESKSVSEYPDWDKRCDYDDRNHDEPDNLFAGVGAWIWFGRSQTAEVTMINKHTDKAMIKAKCSLSHHLSRIGHTSENILHHLGVHPDQGVPTRLDIRRWNVTFVELLVRFVI